jgi:hypothetical protein
MSTAFSAVNFNTPQEHMKPTDLCLVRPVRGRITLRSSAEYLDQLRVRLDRKDTSEPIPSKSRVAALEALREIGSESDRQFA